MKQFEKLPMDIPEITGRMNSFVYNEFDDSLTPEKQMRALIKRMKQSDKLTNEMVDYLNEFIKKFDEKLYDTVEKILKEWLENGILSELIRDAINEEVKEARTNQYGETFKDLKARLDNMDYSENNRKIHLVRYGVHSLKTGSENSLIIKNILEQFGERTTFVLPGGKILISEPINIIGKDIRLESESLTTIEPTEKMKTLIMYSALNSESINQNEFISNINLDCKNLADSGLVVSSTGGLYLSYAVFNNVNVYNSIKSGVLVLGAVWVVEFINCYVQESGGDGFSLSLVGTQQINHVLFNNCQSIKNKGNGIVIGGSSHRIFNCNIEQNLEYGILVNGKHSGQGTNPHVFGLSIYGNYIENNKKGCIKVVSNGGGGISSLSIVDNYLVQNSDPECCIDNSFIKFVGGLEGVTDTIVANNQLFGNTNIIIDGGNALSTRVNLGRIFDRTRLKDIGFAEVKVGNYNEIQVPIGCVTGVEKHYNNKTLNALNYGKEPSIITFAPSDNMNYRMIRGCTFNVSTNVDKGILRVYRIIVDANNKQVDSKSYDYNLRVGENEIVPFTLDLPYILDRKAIHNVYFRIDIIRDESRPWKETDSITYGNFKILASY